MIAWVVAAAFAAGCAFALWSRRAIAREADLARREVKLLHDHVRSGAAALRLAEARADRAEFNANRANAYAAALERQNGALWARVNGEDQGAGPSHRIEATMVGGFAPPLPPAG